MSAFTNEKEIGKAVIAWLTDQRWDVYQEVQREQGSPVADIVATLGRYVVVVELKLSLSFEVIAQARRWQWCSHWQWIAVPQEKGQSRPSDGRRLAIETCERLGIGVMVVRKLSNTENWIERRQVNGQIPPSEHIDTQAFRVQVASFPRICRSARKGAAQLRASLKPEHKTYAEAGAQHGKHWSPFKSTCRDVRDFLEKQPDRSATVREVVTGIKHHYASDASARGGLLTWAGQGKIEGVEVDATVSPYRLRLTAPPSG